MARDITRSIEQVRLAFPSNKDCVILDQTMSKLMNEKSYHAVRLDTPNVLVLDKRYAELKNFYDNNKCDSVLGNISLSKVNEISSTFKEIDEIRINARTDKLVRNRNIIGASILLAGIGVILIVNKKLK